MKENENTETSEGFYLFFYGKGWVEFEYIVFGLNGSQWVFSQNPIITGSNWIDTHLTQLIIEWI